MAQMHEVYKCEACGNIVEILHAGGGTLVCCGQDMILLKANTVDAALEKHVPVIEKKGRTVTVKVGSVPHPMEEKHYIEMIGVWTANKLYRAYLKPGDKPEATFEVDGDVLYAREYCNIHGLWKSA
jgi:superoxide reductase